MARGRAENISSSSSSSSSRPRDRKPGKNKKSKTHGDSNSPNRSKLKRKEGQAKDSSLVVVDSDSTEEKTNRQSKVKTHRRSQKKKSRSRSSSSSSSSRRRSRSRHRCSLKREKSRTRQGSPPYRPIWDRSRTQQSSEPKLPSYALNYLPQSAIDSFQAQAEQPRSETGLQLLGDLCRIPKVTWNYVLKDETRRSFAGHLKSPFDQEQCASFFRKVHAGTTWKRPRDMPRGTAWLVRKGCRCAYRYGGHDVEPDEYPPWMLEILQATMPFFGLTQAADWPTSCNLNLYDTGGSSVAWHADDESLFHGKHQDIQILSLSLGVTRMFELRPNQQNDSRAAQRMTLGNGDLCTMEGLAQRHYQHRVPPDGNVEGPRINLTWRWIVKHSPMCPVGRTR